MQPDGICCILCYLYTSVCLSVHVGVQQRSPSAYQRSPCVLANLRGRSGGVHVAEEVLDPPKGDAAARVTHLKMEPFLFSLVVHLQNKCLRINMSAAFRMSLVCLRYAALKHPRPAGSHAANLITD